MYEWVVMGLMVCVPVKSFSVLSLSLTQWDTISIFYHLALQCQQKSDMRTKRERKHILFVSEWVNESTKF